MAMEEQQPAVEEQPQGEAEMMVQTEQEPLPEASSPPAGEGVAEVNEPAAPIAPAAAPAAAAALVKREPGKGGGSSATKGGSLLSPFMRALAAETPVLEGLYHYPKSQGGVHHEPWIRLFGAVLEPAPDGFVVTDNQATGGASLWTLSLIHI